jgi:hypothetical protein
VILLIDLESGKVNQVLKSLIKMKGINETSQEKQMSKLATDLVAT